jgi:outer membrane murein-binding lipoprotein Lpp
LTFNLAPIFTNKEPTVKFLHGFVLAAILVLAGCETAADRAKLAADQQHFKDTVDSINSDLDQKLLDAEMKNHQLKHGDKAACLWLKKAHPSPNEGRTWKDACTALYGIHF